MKTINIFFVIEGAQEDIPPQKYTSIFIKLLKLEYKKLFTLLKKCI